MKVLILDHFSHAQDCLGGLHVERRVDRSRAAPTWRFLPRCFCAKCVDSDCMKKVVPIAVALVVAVLAGRAVYRSMASEETHIRWLVEEEVEAFNSASISGCMVGFAMQYEDTTLRLNRTSLQQVLLYAFQKRRDPETGRFLYSIQIPDESLQVTLKGDDRTRGDEMCARILRPHLLAGHEIRVEVGEAFTDGVHARSAMSGQTERQGPDVQRECAKSHRGFERSPDRAAR